MGCAWCDVGRGQSVDRINARPIRGWFGQGEVSENMATHTTEERISALEQRVTRVEHVVAKLAAGQAPPKPTAPTPSPAATVAPDADLDGKYGNPVVRKDPPRWDGQSFAGKFYSECPPEYLDNLASFLEWRATKEEAEPEKARYAAYSRRDAARARGWSARKRSAGAPVDSDEIPF